MKDSKHRYGFLRIHPIGGNKEDFLLLLGALYDRGAFTYNDDGSVPTWNELLRKFGRFLNTDLTNYDKKKMDYSETAFEQFQERIAAIKNH